MVGDSGAYTYRAATLTVNDLPKGRYLFIPSTFDPGASTDFSIRLNTSLPVSKPTLLPTEDSGKFVRVLKGRLARPQADRMLGCLRYRDNPRYLVRPHLVCWLSLRLRQVSGASVPLNASIFSDLSSANGGSHPIGGTGPYASYVAGVTSPSTKIRPSSSGYILAISAATESAITGDLAIDYELSVFSDHPVDISPMLE